MRNFLLSLLLWSTAALGDTVHLLSPRGVGVSAAVLESYQELLRVAVVQSGLHVVSGHDADLVLKGTITKVGSGFLLGLEKSGGGAEPYEDTMRVASEDELDTGTRRLVAAVLAGRPARENATVDDVTDAERDAGTNRKRTVRHAMLAFGPSWAYGLGSSDMLYDLAIGYEWESEHLAPRVFLEANWAPGSSDMGSLHSGLGIDWYLLGSRSTPYIGMDAGIGAVSRAHSDANKATDGGRMYYSGFSLGADIGFAIMRTADVSMFIQGSYRPLLGGIAGQAAGIYGAEIGILY